MELRTAIKFRVNFFKWFSDTNFLLQCLSIIKVFLKNFAKFTESYICRRHFFNKVADSRLKRNSSAGAFL